MLIDPVPVKLMTGALHLSQLPLALLDLAHDHDASFLFPNFPVLARNVSVPQVVIDPTPVVAFSAK